jgi:hypothetical protein
MAVKASGSRSGSPWVLWALCTAATSLVLVEASAGVEYVGTGLAQILVNVLGWMPALSLIPLRLAEQSVWHWGTLDVAPRALPLLVLAVLIFALGSRVKKQHRLTRGNSAKQ